MRQANYLKSDSGSATGELEYGPYELTEFEWKTIQPLLPNKLPGVAQVDDRRVLNGIFLTLRPVLQNRVAFLQLGWI